MGANGKHRWKISFHRSSSSSKKGPPNEFLCPISGCIMFDPVVVSSGQTFERASVKACLDLNFTPTLPDGSIPDFFSTTHFIPNLALKSTILNWCSTVPPPPPDHSSILSTVRTLMAKSKLQQESEDGSKIRVSERELLNAVSDKPPMILSHANTELNPRRRVYDDSSSSVESVIANVPSTPLLPFETRPSCYHSPSSSSSVESVIANVPSTPLLPFETRPSCYHSPSSSLSTSSEIMSDEILNPSSSTSTSEDEVFIEKFKSVEVYEQEQGLISLRKTTRTDESARVSLCTPRMLSAIKLLLISRYAGVQTNAAAALVNLSLEKVNKIKIVRSGVVPPLINLLKGGFPESQEHAAGAIFSLALEDDNKTAIGVLGGLLPLLHALRSESERTRNDSALALYHLSLVQSNRVRLIKLGAVNTLLGMLRSGDLVGRVLLVLCNMAASVEGNVAMLDGNAVECFVGILRKGKSEFYSDSTREHCVAALYSLSNSRLRFKALARDANAVEVLMEVAERGGERASEKATRMLAMLRERNHHEGEDEEGEWEVGLDGGLSRLRHRVGRKGYGANSTEF